MIFWLALILCVFACVGISAIGLRNSTWFGTYRSPLSNLKPVDIKIAKISAVLFSAGVLLFVIGFWFK
jgi:hypothetical protein